MSEPRIGAQVPAAQMLAFIAAVLCGKGLTQAESLAVARQLVESELLGHASHGLALLPDYFARIEDGRISPGATIEVVADHGNSMVWNARRAPGAWVLQQAIFEARGRLGTHGVVTVSIAGCSHVGCLQAYLESLGRNGILALLMATSPTVASVAPFGGIDPVITSNPIAACLPTEGDPILIDQSTSCTANLVVAQFSASNRRLPAEWLLSNEGYPSDDPFTLKTEPPGTILPLGGMDLGYKGFGLGLMVEALALALSGYGRDAPRERGGQGVFLQLIDPGRFIGTEVFLRQMSMLVARCKDSRPVPGGAVRLPGERALASKQRQLRDGLSIDTPLRVALERAGDALQVPIPWPRAAFAADLG